MLAHLRLWWRVHRIPADTRVLHALAQHPCHALELGYTYRLLSGTVSAVLTRMERDGLVKRHYFPEDQGRALYSLTRKGRIWAMQIEFEQAACWQQLGVDVLPRYFTFG